MRISDWSSDVCSSDLATSSRSSASTDAGRRAVAPTLAAGQVPDSGVKRYNSNCCSHRIAAMKSIKMEFAQRWYLQHRRENFAASQRLEGITHPRSEEHTSELQSLMPISYAVFCLKKKKTNN